MNVFVAKFQDAIKGILTGFDRIVFKGTIRPLARAVGAVSFCAARGIRNKDFKRWATEQTAAVVKAAEEYAREHGVAEIEPIRCWKTRKEDLARRRQQELQLASGLIGVWSAIEGCWSYKARYSKKAGHPLLHREWTKCKHLYFYFDHPLYGFMSIRLQTWFPYGVQIAMNGREWLKRGLEREGVAFVARGNKFVHVENYEAAQRLLDAQLDTRWEPLLQGFLSEVFPVQTAILGPSLAYYWSLWQSEWAMDLLFATPESLAPFREVWLRHAFMTGTAEQVLRYLDRPLKLDGAPRLNLPHEVQSRLLEFHEGVRVRHWVGQNSVKGYTELNVLRVETTLNDPGMFRVYRHAQGEPATTPKRRLPLREGVADTPLRAKVAQQVNERFLDNLASARNETPLKHLLDAVVKPLRKDGRRVRALDPTGKDRPLLEALADPRFTLHGLANADLRDKLRHAPAYRGLSPAQLAAKVTRQLRLLRDHGLIRKMPYHRRYLITRKGQDFACALCALLAASTQQLTQRAA